MAKRMRRLRAIIRGDGSLYEKSSHIGHYKKEMDDRRRRGYLAKLARRRNRAKSKHR